MSLICTCKSAQAKYKDKNYTGAFEDALKDLKKDKNKKENLPILKKSLSKLVNSYKELYARYSTMTDLDQKAKVADANIDLVNKFHSAKKFIIPDSFYNHQQLLSQNKNLKNEVGNDFLIRATDRLSELKSTNKKYLAPQALLDIEKAEIYLGKNSETTNYKNQIIQYGTVIVNVEAEQWGSDFSIFEIDRVFKNIESYTNSDRLLKVIYESMKPKSQLDCNVEIRLSTIDFAETIENNRLTFTESVPDGYEIKKDDKGNDVKVQKYAKVTGYVQINTRRLRATSNTQTDIDAYTENCSWSENRWTRFVETTREEYSISGDLRAIPSQYRNQPTNRMKSKSELADELLSDIYNVFVNEYLR